MLVIPFSLHFCFLSSFRSRPEGGAQCPSGALFCCRSCFCLCRRRPPSYSLFCSASNRSVFAASKQTGSFAALTPGGARYRTLPGISVKFGWQLVWLGLVSRVSRRIHICVTGFCLSGCTYEWYRIYLFIPLFRFVRRICLADGGLITKAYYDERQVLMCCSKYGHSDVAGPK